MIPKLLLIEDDENLSNLFIEYLSPKGFKIIVSKTEDEAISEFSLDLDFCIFDLLTETINAPKLISKFKGIVRDMPFIYLYANSFPSEIKMKDIDKKLKKPFSLEDVFLAINKIYNN